MNRAYYSGFIASFVNEDLTSVLGVISFNSGKDDILQKNAWKRQIEILQKELKGVTGKIFFEFTIPRMGKRVDNILIINNCIFVIEFKINSKKYEKHAIDQAFDYGLDLNNFHEGSHAKNIIPILVADKAEDEKNIYRKSIDNLQNTIVANENNLSEVISETLLKFKNLENINVESWEKSIYKPTPTIIEAATALYKKHSVSEISRSDSGAENLSVTSECISKIIDHSKETNRKSICFITGVPGAGKTLAGLNIANLRSNYEEEEHAVFLSGNGPLVDVLREALARDKYTSAKEDNEKLTMDAARSQIKSFIQNIHHFRDDAIKNPENAPIEKVTIFDEAQRAWTTEKASSFMRIKKGIPDFNKSEPEFLIEVMNRHKNWCTIVCLIGGGQEINTGEAGLEEWIRPFSNKFQDWDIYYSSKIVDDLNYIKDKEVLMILKDKKAIKQRELHLSVSLRSFRSAQLSDFIQEIINNNIENAKEIYKLSIKEYYPIKITRDLDKARNWLKISAKGSERIGVIASSGGIRLRPFGLNVKVKIDAPIWFLNDKDDIRSSSFLEEVATEFDIQGLELDWTCVAWDGDLFYDDNKWNYKKFTGTTWKNINPIITSYLINSYRVLLTRARQGMVIYIPFGNSEDITRPEFMYDGTFEFFKSLGIEEI
ncbi:uncharacterized protein DUF2075 [Flavobacterium araucananum]|uniref:Schlafen group 3-like DNA/RNA helicase domain-containing protein n=1 Tax=Flavobacterium araucananum TaxID=946678 RepID=A0A227PJG0_9FLAO|nr:DUF2075 domain-containing protein [Flavobacterium araucananum]OXG09418.1 hypothetical protein B0A64_01265 [Flavobacterium araucananum]PWK02801.1 uncharacterized protein DUF2075 [Flavobacterium araucananum]